MLKLSPPLPPLERGSGVLPRKKMNFYIAAREILRISDDINFTLIHWYRNRRQKILKRSPLPPLEAGCPGFDPGKKLSFYIDVRDF